MIVADGFGANVGGHRGRTVPAATGRRCRRRAGLHRVRRDA